MTVTLSPIFSLLKNKLNKQKIISLEVATGSMNPVLKIGQKVNISKITHSNDIQRFDIIVHWDGEKFVCHYVEDIRESIENNEIFLITRGLQNSYEDFPVRYENILGKVQSSLPLVKKIKLTLVGWGQS